ncbi:hypothetical protein MEZE111188_15105 [Mesobacillus zeae]
MESSSEKGLYPLLQWTAVAAAVSYLPVQIVNVVFIGVPGEENEWVLVDAGMPRSADKIEEEAERLFGSNNPPKTVMTHGISTMWVR